MHEGGKSNDVVFAGLKTSSRFRFRFALGSSEEFSLRFQCERFEALRRSLYCYSLFARPGKLPRESRVSSLTVFSMHLSCRRESSSFLSFCAIDYTLSWAEMIATLLCCVFLPSHGARDKRVFARNRSQLGESARGVFCRLFTPKCCEAERESVKVVAGSRCERGSFSSGANSLFWLCLFSRVLSRVVRVIDSCSDWSGGEFRDVRFGGGDRRRVRMERFRAECCELLKKCCDQVRSSVSCLISF